MQLDRNTIEIMRTDFVGKRVRCIEMTDKYNPVPAGTEGTVRHVDDLGTVHVNWDNGQTLGLVINEDKFAIVEPKKCTNPFYINCGFYYKFQCNGCPMYK